MTTIAARDGVLAADSVETDVADGDATWVITHTAKKIFRLPDGSLYGGAGSSEDIWRLYDALRKNQPCPKLDHVSAILVKPNGKMMLYEGHVWLPIREKFYAIGTGAPFAFAAMKNGANAKAAAKIGAAMDPFSGGKVRVLKIKKGR